MSNINLLDIVPPFKRHTKQYVQESDTDSTLAAYIGDAIIALDWRWTRDYIVSTINPNSYTVSPDILMKDLRPIILMASIIYKMGNSSLASYRDGDFAFDPVQGRTNPIALDVSELDKIVPVRAKALAKGFTAPMRGFNNIYNPETYRFFIYGNNFGLPLFNNPAP